MKVAVPEKLAFIPERLLVCFSTNGKDKQNKLNFKGQSIYYENFVAQKYDYKGS